MRSLDRYRRRRSRRSTRHLAATLCAAVSIGGWEAAADQVVAGGVNHPHVTINGFDQGQLLFTTREGEPRRERIHDITLLVVDRPGLYADFNEAERYFAKGNWEKAIVRYRRTLRLSETFWSDLVAARLAIACDRTGRLDQAVTNFVRVARGRWSGPAAAVTLMPSNLSSASPTMLSRTLSALDSAIAKAPGDDALPLLLLARYDILRHVDVAKAKKASQTVAMLKIPESLRCERVYAILLAALADVFDGQSEPPLFASLDDAIRHCPPETLAGFLLLKGQSMLRSATAREEIIRASWPLMRVVSHQPDDPRAADALYAVALALERIGRAGKAVELLDECLAHPRISEVTRREAEAAVHRLQQT